MMPITMPPIPSKFALSLTAQKILGNALTPYGFHQGTVLPKSSDTQQPLLGGAGNSNANPSSWKPLPSGNYTFYIAIHVWNIQILVILSFTLQA
jgi:hypothetical protein